MIVAEGADGLDVCFIRRAERQSDPWSGHVSFPGGRAEVGDRTAYEVAERETREEIGLSLNASHRIGTLPMMQKIRRGLTLFSFVYFAEHSMRTQAVVGNPEEVACVFWVPLRHLFDPLAVTEVEYSHEGNQKDLPGIRFDDHVIWGLTLQLLHSFARLMHQPFPACES
ncbi:MAG: CoA pyrophosphatase [Fuerstiella sp.]|nr:CoA pyrophosphatase [Fuerstiella sp.]